MLWGLIEQREKWIAAAWAACRVVEQTKVEIK